MKTIRIAHIVNPVAVGPESDLYLAQPVTFETLRKAQAQAPSDVEVTLLAAGFPDDLKNIPDCFRITHSLEQSIRDIPGFGTQHRRLPFLADILNRLLEESEAEAMIYSNVDIAVVPEFYQIVVEQLRQGVDGFVINRRTISDEFTAISQIPEMIAQARNGGAPHPGYDCFIFSRRAAVRFQLGRACVGANWSGRVLLANMVRFSRRFLEFKEMRVTFHIGDRREWLKESHDQCNKHNAEELSRILDRLHRGANSLQRQKLRSMRDDVWLTPTQDPASLVKIIKHHSPDRVLGVDKNQVYPVEFRSSSSWEHHERQCLRQDPVFIVGFPRSGTTLVQALLATQPGFVTFPETHFFSLVRAVMQVDNDRIDPECLERVFERIRQRVEFSRQAESHASELACGSGLSPKMLFEIMVVDILAGRFPISEIPTKRWVEKTPHHIHYLDVILRFYPGSRILCMIRNPEKAILSRKRHFRFNLEQEWPVAQHARDWLRGIHTIQSMGKRNPRQILLVKLEEIAADPAKGIRSVCDFLGESFSAEALKNYRELARTMVYPWESWKRCVFQEISPEIAAGGDLGFSWRQKCVLVSMAGKEMSRFGYIKGWRRITPPLFRLLRWGHHQIKEVFSRTRTISEKELPREKWPRKINLGDQQTQFYGKHRCGWKFAVSCLSPLHNPGGVDLDSFIERTFAWNREVSAHNRPWIGFIHIPPNVPNWFQSHQSNKKVFSSEGWRRSLPFCRGLFTLSRYHRRYLESILNLPVNHLYFPTQVPELRWSWERFRNNPSPGVVQVGWWLRRIHSIFRLSVDGTNLRKIFLKTDHFDWDYLIRKERKILVAAGQFNDEMYSSAKTVSFLPDREYDHLLSENIVFLDLYDSSANNTIIECMARATPILINPLESVREYLGEEYPLYYRSLEEATEILRDPERIHAAHRYLAAAEVQDRLRPERFVRDFARSEIYRSL